MTVKKLMLSSAILALVAGSAVAQEATQPLDPAVSAETGTTADATAEMEPRPQSLEEMTVGDVLGTPVVSPEGEGVGEIDYVIMMGDGAPGAVIGVGGFLGLGEYTVALPLSEFTYDSEQYAFIANQTKEQLKAIPEFDETGVESLPDETPVADLLAQAAPPAAESGTESADLNAGATGAGSTEVAPADDPATAESDMAADTGTSTEVAPADDSATAESDMAADTGTSTEVAPADDSATAESDMAADTGTSTEVAPADGSATAESDMAADTGTSTEVAPATEGASDDVAQAPESAEGTDTAPAAGQETAAVTAAPESLKAMSVAEAIGTRVQADSGQDVGELEYIVMQADKSLDAVVGIGGFLGVGEYDVALPLDSFTYDEEQKILQVAMTEEELRQVPQYDEVSAEGAEKLPKDAIIGEAAAN